MTAGIWFIHLWVSCKLDIEAEYGLGGPAVGNINQAPVSLYDDGGVLYFKWAHYIDTY